jgi:hypothetical protein
MGSGMTYHGKNVFAVSKKAVKFAARLTDGVTGNTSGFGPEESRFEP